MIVLIGALMIVVGSLALAAIHEYVRSMPLAVILQLALLTAVVAIFILLR
jgi:hypothetical protein